MNLPVPPKVVRRLLLAPLVMAMAFGIFTTLPLLLIGAAVVSPFLPGSWRALRLLAFALFYLAMELLGLIAALGLWIASGFGARIRSPRFVTWHYALLRWALRALVVAAEWLFELKIVEEPGREAKLLRKDRPVIVMSRHAGPGDSFLLTHEILANDRRPRIVLKDTLQLDPFIDVVLNRLPNRFICTDPRRRQPEDDPVAAIADLAETMGPADALLIFPEGGNFTEQRRIRAIERLRSHGELVGAARAEALVHVLPPRQAGAFAALDGCSSADAVFVAHAGLDGLDTVADLWHAIPQNNTLTVSWQTVPREEVPSATARGDWLDSEWSEIDRWVARQHTRRSENAT